MKKVLFSAILLSLLSLTGCNSTTNQPQTPAEQAPEQTPEQPGPAENATDKNLPAPTHWRSFYTDGKQEDIKALFEKARQIVANQKGVTGELNSWSKYFGPWVIVEIKKEIPPDMIALDAPMPENPVFLVDMAAEKVIEMGDWKSSKPFFDAQIAVIKQGFSSDDKRRDFIANMASAASVLGFGHTRYMDYPSDGVKYPRGATGPSFKYDMNSAELVYYVNSTGMMFSITKCVLTITQNSIVFNSEIL